MTTILIVDDNAMNRKLLATQLACEGYATIEASDGREALECARRERPDLVISDILMPTMDGYEFVRRVRAEAELARLPVIFHTANYHEREARALAADCGVARVLVKPCESALLLAAVAEALGGASTRRAAVPEQFDREHLRLVTDKLAANAAELNVANARLRALNELNLQLASERDARVLLGRVCAGARELLGARFAVLAVADAPGSDSVLVATNGLEAGSAVLGRPRVDAGMLGAVHATRRSCRLRLDGARQGELGLPPGYPRVEAVLAVPLASLTRSYGWLCLADKVGAAEFDSEDERVLGVLGAQVGRIYENGSLYREVQQHATQLLVEMEERERAIAGLRDSEERFRQLADNIDDAFFVVSATGRIVYLSPAYEKIWGAPRAIVYADPSSWFDTVHPGDRERVRELALHADRSVPGEARWRIHRADGTVRWVLARWFPVFDRGDVLARVVGIATDITERTQAEARIENLNRVLAVLSGINALIVRVADREELLREACRLAVDEGRFRLAWCGWLQDDGAEILPIAWAGDRPDLARLARPRLAGAAGEESMMSIALRTRSPVVCNDLTTTTLRIMFREQMLENGYRAVVVLPLLPGGRPVGCLVLTADQAGFFDDPEMRLLGELAGDISFALDHIEKSERLNYLAYYDVLTGLANRSLFIERLRLQVSAAARAAHKLALLIVYPERLDAVYEGVGRVAGDELLRLIGERLVRSAGNAENVSRISQDQFAVVVPVVRSDSDVLTTIAEWRRETFAENFDVGGQRFAVSARTGVAIYPADGESAEGLLRNAEAALKKARISADLNVFYTPHLSERLAQRAQLERSLQHAFDNGQFLLHYQPKVDLEQRTVLGVEALLRWNHPERGLVQPGDFIPLLEQSGMIVDVGAWVLRRARIDRLRWLEKFPTAPRIAVNVSTVQLLRDDFVSTVAEALDGGGGHAGIDIEVTESLLADEAVDNIAKLAAVRELGVHIALDDFGTGYSSLAYLAKLPVETLKIDRSFVSAMLDDPGAMTLVSTIISLAHALELETVAEGVELEEQAKILRLLRCDQMQGYLISRPLAFDEMTAWMALRRAVAEA
jgi:PAS domain S-box-containing protein/diguanylate cyclase (GGDEF)-like protein